MDTIRGYLKKTVDYEKIIEKQTANTQEIMDRNNDVEFTAKNLEGEIQNLASKKHILNVRNVLLGILQPAKDGAKTQAARYNHFGNKLSIND